MRNSWGGDPDTIPWVERPEAPGRRYRHIGEGPELGPFVVQLQWEPGVEVPGHWHECDTVYIINEGSVYFGEGEDHHYRAGDIRWVRAGHFYGPERAGPEGCTFTLVGQTGDLEPHYSDHDATGMAEA